VAVYFPSVEKLNQSIIFSIKTNNTRVMIY